MCVCIWEVDERDREMGDCEERLSLWWSSSSKVKRFVILFLAVSGFVVFILGPWSPSWVSFASHSPWSWTSSEVSPLTPANTTVTLTEEGGHLGLHSSPPSAVEAKNQGQQADKEEESLNITKNGPHSIPSINKTNPIPAETRLQKKYRNLEGVEASLAQARAAIREAKNGNQTQDPDFIPRGPVYWNSNAFHRSYLEMEKQFKVYVYEEGEPPVFHYGLSKGVLGLEGIFIHHMEISQFRTGDPEKAHVFFLPFSVIGLTNFVFIVDSHAWGPMKNTVIDYVNVIAQKHPYWNRSRGADHFMLACHDWGPEISFGVPYLYKNSIRALCNANTSEKFNPSKDVSIPEIFLPEGTMDGLLGGPSPSKRPILVFFAGGLHGPIRKVLLDYWENKDPEVQVQRYLPKNVSYYEKMRSSKFCICPSGYEVASPRMVEGLYMGCVPVLIKDHYVAPFSDVLNWKRFAVEVPVKDIPNLKRILMGISQKQYIRMQRRGLQVRRHFEVNSPPKRFDVFHMILHSIWLRRLNIRVYDNDHS